MRRYGGWRRRLLGSQVAVLFTAVSLLLVQPSAAVAAGPRERSYRVVNTYPHDNRAFTEGLLWYRGYLYESTGLFGSSTLRRVELRSGAVVQMVDLPPDEFGEGLALADPNRLALLNLNTRHGFIFDRETFALLGEFPYETEGWGLTNNGSQLIMSDGSNRLTFLDPNTFQPVGQLSVTFAGQPLIGLNELEFIRGEIWANVFPTDRIVRIDPATGEVTSFLDLGRLFPAAARTSVHDVPNGIAYNAATNRVFVTGKRWPFLFEIRVRR